MCVCVCVCVCVCMCVCVLFLKSLICCSEPKQPWCQFSFSETRPRLPGLMNKYWHTHTHTRTHLREKVALFRPCSRHFVWSHVPFPECNLHLDVWAVDTLQFMSRCNTLRDADCLQAHLKYIQYTKPCICSAVETLFRLPLWLKWKKSQVYLTHVAETRLAERAGFLSTNV